MGKVIDIYGNRDPRDLPLYTINQAASYLKVPPSTVRGWTLGNRWIEQLIRARQPAHGVLRLTFNQLAELFVLSVMRKTHGIEMPAIRTAIKNLKRQGYERPLLAREFATDGVRVYLLASDRALEVSTGEGNQFAIPAVIRQGLERIVRNKSGVVEKLRPFVKFPDMETRVEIDPRVSFGRPTIEKTGIQVAVLTSLIHAGETYQSVANEYQLKESVVREAVGWQLSGAA